MNQTTSPITTRIEWCRQQIAQARTEPEVDVWRAEEHGLRDAIINRDRTHDYRLCPPEILERYRLGFRDGTMLLRAAQIERMARAAIDEASQPAFEMDEHIFLGDDR